TDAASQASRPSWGMELTSNGGWVSERVERRRYFSWRRSPDGAPGAGEIGPVSRSTCQFVNRGMKHCWHYIIDLLTGLNAAAVDRGMGAVETGLKAGRIRSSSSVAGGPALSVR